MQQLFPSAFLQSLGYAIANSLWQTALVWLLYNLLTLIPSRSAAFRYRMAVAAQLTGFTWFLSTFRFYYLQYAHAWQLPAAGNTSSDTVLGISDGSLYTTLISWMVKAEQLLPYVSMAYLLLLLLLCVRWIRGYQKTQEIRYTGLEKMPVDWRLFVQRTTAQLGIRRKVQVFLSDKIAAPLTIGFWKPLVLVPLASINHLTTAQVEAVLLHELAHIKRADYLVNLLLSLVEIGLFFNPFTQLLSKSIHKERENSCDDWVLQFQYEAADYAKALLCIATWQQTPALAMAANGRKNELLIRVKRMIGQEDSNRFSYRRQLMALLLMTGILSSIAWFVPHTAQSHTQPASAVQQRLQLQQKKIQAAEPIAVVVENPLFNPVFFLSKPLKAAIHKNIAEAKKEMKQAWANETVTEKSLAAVVPELVTGALEKAAAQLDKEITDPAKDLLSEDFLTTAKINPKHPDSAWQKKIQVELPDEIRKLDMRKVRADIDRAGAEVAKAMKEITLTLSRQKQVKQQLAWAMQEMDRLKKNGWDKAVRHARNLPNEQGIDPVLPEPVLELPAHKEPGQPAHQPSFISPKKTDPDKEEADNDALAIYPVKRVNPQWIVLLDSLVQDNRLQPQVLAKIKALLLQQQFLRKAGRVKMVPTVIIRSLPDSTQPDHFLIRFQ